MTKNEGGKPGYNGMEPADLLVKRRAQELELFKLRMQTGGPAAKNVKALKYAKKELARILTAYSMKTKQNKPEKKKGSGRG